LNQSLFCGIKYYGVIDMKHFLSAVIVVAGISVLAVVPFANARGGGFGGPGLQGSGHWGGTHGGHFHDHSGFFFVGAFPFWYPYYGSPYYSYYYDSAPPTFYNYNDDRNPAAPSEDTRSYLVLGHDTGKSLRNKSVTGDWFVEYLQAYIVNAPSWVRDDFQRGFISGFGNDGESTYKKGIQQVERRNIPNPENPTSLAPNSGSQRY
jgi:hypothetical protein